MQFCTIDEAWGRRKIEEANREVTNTEPDKNMTENSISSILKNNKIIQNPNKKPDYNFKKKIYFNTTEDTFTDAYTDTINDRHERNALINRVLNSKRCRESLRKKLTPNLVSKLNIMLENYKDVIVIVLIGFCILIFFNMLYNINKK